MRQQQNTARQAKLSPGTMAALRDRVIATLEEHDEDTYLRVCGACMTLCYHMH